MMTDLIIVVVLVIICGAAAGYIYKAKKSGAMCIGCSAGKGCCCSCGGSETWDSGSDGRYGSCCCCHVEAK